MILSFVLSMPNRGSWNGGWSGEKNLYAKVVNFGRGKEKDKKAQEILDKGYFRYNFGDGWSAGIAVIRVDGKEASNTRRKSCGFCGYEWMVDSIINNLEIISEVK